MIPINIPNPEIVDLHYKGICKLFDPAQINTINGWLANYNLNFEKLIKAEPYELRQIKKRIKSGQSARWPQPQMPELIKDTYSRFSKFSINQYCGAQLIRNLKITVCPYCNRTFINNFEKDGKIKRSSQIDHFFPKGMSKYPYLALSFYNLIPSCYSCNHAKGVRIISISPYELKSSDDALRFKVKFPKENGGYNLDNVNLHLEVVESFKKNSDEFGLEDLYDNHNDIAREIWLKGKAYSDSRIKDLLSSFPDLFDSEKEISQIIMGNYLDEEDLGKRPLSKLTRDIARDVGFIK
ncbi:hypothetical protein GQR60_17860 [Labilibaculum sp. A4]|uniref:HNH endonuclease n=1 Tax=Labilibaculum euxinus TaxID=2686357 RepID=UPI000F617AB1|nr:hypothetical protein [Labilibaculum euxinus]MDQ1772510.1 hypothetical protein [Labilibaculum euxinus]MWN78204.1 hypothetical protein [Labilibaculum euxinus]